MIISLTSLCYAVRKRCTSTWSLSATSIPASPPPLVRLLRLILTAAIQCLTIYTGHLIYKCGGIDKRTIEKFEKVRFPHFYFSRLIALPLGGAGFRFAIQRH
jgi:hypothetical protein